MAWASPAFAIDQTYSNGQNQTEPLTITENSTLKTQTGGTEVAVQSGNISFSSPFVLTLRPVDATDQLTITGVISGAGSLAIEGAGTTILTGNNTFTGGIAVNGTGVLSARGSNAFGTGTVTVNNAAAIFNFGGGVEIGNGFILNTNSTFSTLTGGTEAALISGPINLGANTLSLIAVNANDLLGLDGVISGTGSLAVSGEGNFVLGNDNTFTGGVTFTGSGSLNVTASAGFGTGTVTLNNAGAELGFGSGVNVANNIVLLTNGMFSTFGAEVETGTLSGNVNLNANTLSLLSTNPGDQLILSGIVSGSGSIGVDGGGVVILSGVNTYAGGTAISSGGTLIVNGSITGNTTVANLGTLGGTGTVGSVTVDGRLAPGAAVGTGIGTLTTTGNVTFNSGSSLVVQLDPGGSSDLLSVGGTTSINSGATINADLTLSSFVVGQTFTVLQSTGAITGGFGSVVSNFSFLGLTIVQTGNTIDVKITSVNTLATVIDAASFSSAVAAANGAANGSAIQFGPAAVVNLAANAPAFNLGTNTIYVLGYGATINGNGFTALTLSSGTLVLADLTINGAVQVDGGTLGIGTNMAIGTLSGAAGSGLNLLGSALTITQAADSTFSGVVSGPGSLILDGPGTLTLGGVNTYLGGTALNGTGGVNAIGNRALGTGPVTINNAAAFIGVGNSVILPNAITLTTAGLIQTILGGTESGTLSGSITLNANALRLLAFDAGDVLTVNGTISGTGGVTMEGTGTVVLGGENTFTGDVSLEGAGALRANNNTALGAGSVFFNNAEATLQLGNGVDVANAVVLNTDGAIGTASGGSTQVGTLSGDVDTQGNALILTPGDAADKVTLAGVISGAGSVTKEGAGTAVLAADHTYTGGTTVDAGTLLLTGTISGPTTVNAMGTFGGTGTLTGNLAVSGTVAPGASIGTLNVVGDVAFDSVSTFNPEVSSEDGADLLNVTGTLDFDGGRLLVSPVLGDFPIGTSFTVATATGGITGSFGTLESSVHFFLPSYEIIGTDLTVSLEVRDIREFALTPNQLAMATLVNEILQNAAVPEGKLTNDQIFVFDSLFLDEDGIPENLDLISGAGQATFATTAIAEMTARNNNLTRHVNYSRRCYLPNRDDDFRSNCMVIGTGPGRLSRSGENIARYGKGMFWVNGYHGNATGSAGFGGDFDLTGVDLGFDGWLKSGILIGFSGGYSRVQGNNFSTLGRGETEKGYASVYASKAFGNGMYATGIFTAGFGDMETFRMMDFGNVGRAAKGHFDGNVFSGYGEFGYDLELSGFMLQPFAAVQYLGINFSDYTETGGGALNLQVDGMSISSLQGIVGVRVSRVFYDVFLGFNIEPELYVKFTQEFASAKDDLVTEVKFIENVSKVSIVNPGSFSGGLTFGGSVDVSRGGKMRVTFDIDFFQSSVYDITTLGGRASWVF